MELKKLMNIQIIPGAKDPFFNQRESKITHTTYLEETVFYTAVQQGNTALVKQMLKSFTDSGIVVGHLSDNSIRQMQYWAVCCITLGIRYAIQGGLDEMLAYNLSDQYIMQIDKLTSPVDIPPVLWKMVTELTELVQQSTHRDCPIQVRKCLDYIDKHLHEAIRLSDLSALTKLNGDYLSKLFKKHVGKTVRDYIINKKLEAAKAMLRGEYDSNQVAYYLGFCSQTYFIACFKKAFGTTPHKYAAQYH